MTDRKRQQHADPFAAQDDDVWEDTGNDSDRTVAGHCTHTRTSAVRRMAVVDSISTMRPPVPAATYLAWLVARVVVSGVVAAVGTVLVIVALLGGVAFLFIKQSIDLHRR